MIFSRYYTRIAWTCSWSSSIFRRLLHLLLRLLGSVRLRLYAFSVGADRWGGKCHRTACNNYGSLILVIHVVYNFHNKVEDFLDPECQFRWFYSLVHSWRPIQFLLTLYGWNTLVGFTTDWKTCFWINGAMPEPATKIGCLLQLIFSVKKHEKANRVIRVLAETVPNHQLPRSKQYPRRPIIMHV